MKITPEQSDKSRDFTNVLILLTIALCLGIYLIVTTVIIARDGITFIKYAQRFETAPVKTMVEEAQHPGYPLLILTAHKITSFLPQSTSIMSWVYCGQSATLIFRLFAVIILYFIGKHLLGAKMGFWGMLVLVLLPKPAEYGSNTLSDWPHLCFLTAGLLLLFNGATNKKWWLFGFAGLAIGAGYMVRPECALLAFVAGLWLALQFLLPERIMSRGKILSALVLMLVGFLVVAGPYMKLKGAIFPKKNVGQFTANSQQQENSAEDEQVVSKSRVSSFTPRNIAKGIVKLAGNIGETLMWFFVPAMFIGMYKWLKTRKWYEPEKFLIIVFIVINTFIMIWLYCKHGYMSYRHTLPMLLLPILYVPIGLQELAVWLQKKFFGEVEPSAAVNRNERFWFVVLFLIGILICVPKWLMPIQMQKQGYRAAAEWLKANTNDTDIIAIPDYRISFYAQREGRMYKEGSIPDNAVYVVKILENTKDRTMLTDQSVKIEYEYVDKTKRDVGVIIYRKP